MLANGGSIPTAKRSAERGFGTVTKTIRNRLTNDRFDQFARADSAETSQCPDLLGSRDYSDQRWRREKSQQVISRFGLRRDTKWSSPQASYQRSHYCESLWITFDGERNSGEFCFGSAHKCHQRMSRSNLGASLLQGVEHTGDQGAARVDYHLAEPVTATSQFMSNKGNGIVRHADPNELRAELSRADGLRLGSDMVCQVARTSKRARIIARDDLRNAISALA